MTTITSGSTIGITISSPSYVNPIVIDPGITISNNGNAVFANTGPWTIENHGTIVGKGSNGSGIYLGFGGSVTNAASASIAGGFEGIVVIGGSGTVVNDGSIAATNGAGVKLQSGLITNAASASITGSLDGIVMGGGSTASVGIVVNYGSIAVTGANGFCHGVALYSGGSVLNDGSIAAIAANGRGVQLYAAGSVTNATSASIIGGFRGVLIGNAAGTVVNYGTIAGTAADATGVKLNAGGSVTNAASARISGTAFGVYLAAGGTLTNAGTVIGNTGTAVYLGGTASNLLVLDPGYGLSGVAVGGTSATNTLELASAASTGTLSGLGTQFIGFAQTTIDAGASWVFNGANTIEAGATMTELSGSTLTVSGTLVNDGAIVLEPSTLDTEGLTGTGLVTIDAGSRLEVQGTVAGGETVMFAGSGAYLHLDTPGSVAGGVTNFGTGETIDLKAVNPASVTYSGGLLSFSGGSFALALTNPGTVSASTSGDGAAISFIPCFRAGTRIRTERGEVLVEDLKRGEPVLAHGGGGRLIPQPVVWIGRRSVDCRRHSKPELVWPVRVRAGAFGAGQPGRDLWLSPDHAVFVDDVLIPVRLLINGATGDARTGGGGDVFPRGTGGALGAAGRGAAGRELSRYRQPAACLRTPALR